MLPMSAAELASFTQNLNIEQKSTIIIFLYWVIQFKKLIGKSWVQQSVKQFKVKMSNISVFQSHGILNIFLFYTVCHIRLKETDGYFSQFSHNEPNNKINQQINKYCRLCHW